MDSSAGFPLSFHSDDDLSTPRASRIEGPFASLEATPQPQAATRNGSEESTKAPLHPIASMQQAFAESLDEATSGAFSQKPKLRFGDAKERRAQLLDESKDAPHPAWLWRYRPGQQQHELWKLMAQVAFGVYLLLNGIANSKEQVVRILQGHIDEIDEFLEVTMEDLKLAAEDVSERIDFLKLPMENIETFEQMLEDRSFRLQIVTGNEKIEHIIARTATALTAALMDVTEGLTATKDFAVYLRQQQNGPWRQSPHIVPIFNRMMGNVEGWFKAFQDLQVRGAELDALLVTLGQIVAEMNRRAGEVSRKTRFSIAPFSGLPEVARSSPESMSRSSLVSSPDENPSPSSIRRPSVATDNVPPSSTEILSELAGLNHQPLQTEAFRFEPDSAEVIVTESEPLYILQPRTYTPQPPSSIPSPRLQDPPSPKSEEPVKRTSLRQRVSLKGTIPPDSIQVPPPNSLDLQRNPFPTPRTYQGPDSAYGSDIEKRPSVLSTTEKYRDFSPPVFPNTIPSPLSDQQYFRPVRASPHSPLQRPWTAGPTTMPRFPPHPGHIRNAPSAMGLSMLSNVETVNSSKKALKKKRSAFGWLKKAFSLNEEEKAAFEARKREQTHNLYYDERSPKFLDGRRVYR